jgi:hypothetical protein
MGYLKGQHPKGHATSAFQHPKEITDLMDVYYPAAEAGSEFTGPTCRKRPLADGRQPHKFDIALTTTPWQHTSTLLKRIEAGRRQHFE